MCLSRGSLRRLSFIERLLCKAPVNLLETERYINFNIIIIIKVVKTANTSNQASKSFALQQHDVARVFTKYMQLSKSERTEAMTAPDAMADIQVLYLMAKQILSKKIKLQGVKLQDALHILVEGSLEQKRSILITQPSLLTVMIKKSKGNLANTTKPNSPNPTAAHGSLEKTSQG